MKKQKRITYEYVVWKELMIRKEDIKALVKFCKYVPCKGEFNRI